jgi:hypothetical protein
MSLMYVKDVSPSTGNYYGANIALEFDMEE